MKLLAVLFGVIVLSSFHTAYAEEPIILEQLTPSGKLLVKLEWPNVEPDSVYKFKVSFHDPETGELLSKDRGFAYGVYVTQHDHIVEEYDKTGTKNGVGWHEVMFPEGSEGSAKVEVFVRAGTDHGNPIIYDESVTFTVNVVPEFGVIAGIVFAAALVPILLLSKSRLQIR